MLFEKNDYILHARLMVDMRGESPAREEKALLRSLAIRENMCVRVHNGRIISVSSWKASSLPEAVPVYAIDDALLMPAVVNAHSHLQLSHLAGKTRWNEGFSVWLASLIPLLRMPLDRDAILSVVQEIEKSGTAIVGDYTGHGMAAVADAVKDSDVACQFFCEWFGFAAPFIDNERPWPPRCREFFRKGGCTGETRDASVAPSAENLFMQAAPCGHALYSTDAVVLRDIHAWCREQHKPFSLHLAESPEETEALISGQGALVDLYKESVLPEGWQAPHMEPVQYADSLGLLDSGTLAVHGVHCDAAARTLLAEKGVNLCLCPRSNRNLAVGEADITGLMRAGVLLCLGTDGLTSNQDLDVRQEARYPHEHNTIPWRVLIRMLTCNCIHALGRQCHGICVVSKGLFCVLPRVSLGQAI